MFRETYRYQSYFKLSTYLQYHNCILIEEHTLRGVCLP